MKEIKDYVAIGCPYIINSMNEKRYTRRDGSSIIFKNGRVASIVTWSDKANYSVAVCDYNGYFDWDILRVNFNTKDGAVLCDTEQEVCEVLEYIKNL